MNGFDEWVLAGVLGALCYRFTMGLRTIRRSNAFLRSAVVAPLVAEDDAAIGRHGKGEARKAVLVVPAMMEQATIEKAVSHFATIANSADCGVVVVTTERDSLLCSPGIRTTRDVVGGLDLPPHVRHIHYPHLVGAKADQLNFVQATLNAEGLPGLSCLIVYDVDSRPSADSLKHFVRHIAGNPSVNVFQQCSRFAYRPHGIRRGIFFRALRNCATLRINRFVLLYELPRIRRRATGSLTGRLTYAHVVGHGLAVRSGFWSTFPLPNCTGLEDMLYGFLLNSRNEAVMPVPCTDDADVPVSLRDDLSQAARWFSGPASGLQYFRHPACRSSATSLAIALHALIDSCAWLLLAACIPLLVLLCAYGSRPVVYSALALVAAYGATVIGTIAATKGRAGVAAEWILALALYPFWLTAFGAAGWWGLWMLMRPRATGLAKTPHY